MIYDDDSAEKLFMEAKQVYQDRGMMKWIGFYLSDHTAVLNKESKVRNHINIGGKDCRSKRGTDLFE